MPFVMFKTKEDHKIALDIIASVMQSFENGSLERLALFSPIIRLESRFNEQYRGVYVFCTAYLELFKEQGIKYSLFQSPEDLIFALSEEGQNQLKYIEEHRPQHLV